MERKPLGEAPYSAGLSEMVRLLRYSSMELGEAPYKGLVPPPLAPLGVRAARGPPLAPLGVRPI